MTVRKTLQHTATNCNSLQHNATHNTLQHNATQFFESHLSKMKLNTEIVRFDEVENESLLKVIVCETWLIYMRDMTHPYVWLIHMYDLFLRVMKWRMILSSRWLYVRHDSFVCVIWLIHMYGLFICVMKCRVILSSRWLYVRHDSFVRVTWLCVTWLTHICDMTHSYVTWLIHMCDMTHSCVTWLIHVWHDSLISVTWLTHMCDMTHIRGCDMTHFYTRFDGMDKDSLLIVFTCETWLIRMCDRDVTHIRTYAMTPS